MVENEPRYAAPFWSFTTSICGYRNCSEDSRTGYSKAGCENDEWKSHYFAVIVLKAKTNA